MNRSDQDDRQQLVCALVVIFDDIDRVLTALGEATEIAQWEETEQKFPKIVHELAKFQQGIAASIQLAAQAAEQLVKDIDPSIAERCFELTSLARRHPDQFSNAWIRHRAWFRAHGFVYDDQTEVSMFAMPTDAMVGHIRQVIKGNRKSRSDGASKALKAKALSLRAKNKSWTWTDVGEELRRNHKYLIPTDRQKQEDYPTVGTMQDWQREFKRQSN